MSLEVGSSRDGFWPSPARIGTLSAATLWPALTFAHRAAAQLPPSDEMGGDGTGEAGAGNGRTGVWLQLNVHNAGLHDIRCLADPPARWRLCVQAPGGWAHMLPAAEWRSGGQAWRLPPLGIVWQRTGAKPWLRLALSFEPVGDLSAAAAALIAPPRLLEVATDRKTLSGSECGKPAVAQRSPANRASGTANQFFAYTPSRGAARCTVSASHLGLVLVVYRSCGRLGPQQPVGFGNTERRRTLRVSVPCESGQPLIIYWSAEYAPGSFLFAVSEEPGSSAHRHRAL
ncbi:hypothetical protein EMIHUDRAFT_229506 [Emiliania huxleyi CCMP1516]|uniref:DUF756 domain-containing protein n=2 Tax=Emiliania huxleyi TaxID=2903 RepID=A0A0D3KCT9_EMIH1|nr:hypothetical protein EMIHUDRAFT_229506 [Emiliania huxleyi CCMP1516]EOD33574.1 hypothetical protein EMIHUDRAFT_229506 [Emiliania huxleyi CCMP1516]|eukprot:XP_005786003.1 hypothetical protein EMIHUDRAFT_229506 [Emiliania huxleyi CCMP1516]